MATRPGANRNDSYFRRELAELKKRVGQLETDMSDMKTTVLAAKANTDMILDAVTTTKTVWTYAKKLALPVATFLVGAGYINPAFGRLIGQIFGVS